MQGKLSRKKTKLKYLKESLHYREQELEKKEIVLRRASQNADDAQKELKNL